MFTFHYLICDSPIKENEKFQIKKLIFQNDNLQSSDDILASKKAKMQLLSDLDEKNYKIINDSKIDIDLFLKNIKLTKV